MQTSRSRSCPCSLFWDESVPGSTINGGTGEKTPGGEITVKSMKQCFKDKCPTCPKFLHSLAGILGLKKMPDDLKFCKYSYTASGGCFIWQVEPKEYRDHVDGLEVINPLLVTPENRHEDWYWRGDEDTQDGTTFTSLSSVKRLLGCTSQQGTYSLAQSWLADCDSFHAICGKYDPAPLPDRVLDVTGNKVRLYETASEKMPYTCLSHCWGGVKASCTTLQANLESQKEDIAWHSLPQTLKDSIEITRAMNVQYIWIDNLCIIQDDANDWLVQAGKMASIYAQCYFAISATAALSDDGGCFRYATNDPIGDRILIKNGIDPAFPIYLRAQLQGHWQTMPHYRRTVLHDGNLGAQAPPLFTRAWCYQEMVLSPRILRFDEFEVSWCCRSTECCSCGYLEKKVGYRPHPFSLAAPQDAQDTWHEILGTYGQLSLTFEADKLPAISAVAETFQDKYCKGDKYVAGMWSSSLLVDMLWVNSTGPGQRLQRQNEWRAPSWSWASCNHPVSLNVAMRNNRLEVQAQVLDLYCEPLKAAPFARFCPGAYIVLSGTTSPGFLDSTTFEFTNTKGTLDDRYRKQGNRFMSSDVELMQDRIKVTALLIATDSSLREYWMLLRRTKADGSIYERAGVLFFDPIPQRDASGYDEKVVKIV